MLNPEIIYQNELYLVINKPPGVVVDRAVTNKNETIQDWVEENHNHELAKDFSRRNGIVHRLDKDTSGVLVIAKTTMAYEALQKQFKERETLKEYVALVHGRIEKAGTIDAPVGRLPWNRTRFGVFPGGKSAKTDYEILENLKKNSEEFTLLKLHPETGRTHQIRVHLKHIGFPIVSDTFYAGRKTARNDLKWCPRLFLHAKSLEFNNPADGLRCKYECVLPLDLASSLENLENS